MDVGGFVHRYKPRVHIPSPEKATKDPGNVYPHLHITFLEGEAGRGTAVLPSRYNIPLIEENVT